MAPLLPRSVWPLVPLMALLAGCATTYDVKVDSISKPAPAAPPQSFLIKSKDPRLGDENLRYLEAKEFVKTALSGKGLYEAPSEDKADMIVELEYGMDTPRTKIERVSTPIYGQVGGGTRYVTVPTTDSHGNTTMRTVAVYDAPKTELLGYDEVPREVTIYEKYLRLTAVENKAASEGKAPAEIWNIEVSAEDESKDLRKYLPIMASASIDYIGKDSTNQQVVKVRENGPGVEFIKRGMSGDDGTTTLAVRSTATPKS